MLPEIEVFPRAEISRGRVQKIVQNREQKKVHKWSKDCQKQRISKRPEISKRQGPGAPKPRATKVLIAQPQPKPRGAIDSSKNREIQRVLTAQQHPNREVIKRNY